MRAQCPTCSEDVTIASTSHTRVVTCPHCVTLFRAPSEEDAEGTPGTPLPPASGLRRTCPRCGGEVPVGRSRCRACGVSYLTAKREIEEERISAGGFAPERAGLSAGVVGGAVMVAIAVVWFWVGWNAGYIFYYPPVLAGLGIFGIVKGLAEGNVAGARRSRWRRGRSRSRGRGRAGPRRSQRRRTRR